MMSLRLTWECMQRFYDVTESVCRGSMMPLRLIWECVQRFCHATETNWECMQRFYDATETTWECMQRFYDATETNLRVYAEVLWCHWDWPDNEYRGSMMPLRLTESVCRGFMMPLRLTWECMQRFYDATETNLRVYAKVLWCHWE